MTRPVFHVAMNPEANEGFITDDRFDADWTCTGLPALSAQPALGCTLREWFIDEEDPASEVRELPRKYALLFNTEQEAMAAADKLAGDQA